MTNEVKIALLLVVTAFTGWLFAKLLTCVLLRRLLQPATLQSFLQSLATDLLDTDTVIDQLKDPQLLRGLNPLIEKHIDTFLVVKLTEKLPFVSTFMGESTLAKIKEGMVEEINLLLPGVITEFAQNVEQKLDINHIISTKLTAVTGDKLAALVKSNFSKEIQLIQVAGAIMGLIIGLLAIAVQGL